MFAWQVSAARRPALRRQRNCGTPIDWAGNSPRWRWEAETKKDAREVMPRSSSFGDLEWGDCYPAEKARRLGPGFGRAWACVSQQVG